MSTSLDQRIDVLERQVMALRRSMKGTTEFVDVVTSPLWKRAVWWAQGFYFRKVGRWYGRETYQPRWPK
jgi:hypothetical protein